MTIVEPSSKMTVSPTLKALQTYGLQHMLMSNIKSPELFTQRLRHRNVDHVFGLNVS